MPVTAHELRSRLRPGELPRIVATVTRGATPEARRLAAGALVLLAGPGQRGASSSPVPAGSAALAAHDRSEAAWADWTRRTFGIDA